jgi:hypothetical protein
MAFVVLNAQTRKRIEKDPKEADRVKEALVKVCTSLFPMGRALLICLLFFVVCGRYEGTIQMVSGWG